MEQSSFGQILWIKKKVPSARGLKLVEARVSAAAGRGQDRRGGVEGQDRVGELRSRAGPGGERRGEARLRMLGVDGPLLPRLPPPTRD